ncbi:MAG: stability/partitioning determinant [Proteobacteria bacterium]|nr:stability/partitioning determinant [Pseudomonadota bacterium]
MDRADPFGDLKDLAEARPSKPVVAAQIDRLAQESGFLSRQPPAPAAEPLRRRQRHVTGRNQQINIKATAETVAKLYRLADDRRCALGQVLEEALAALEQRGA